MATPSKLVIVESPSKAKTIGKYLGPLYTVKASMGHLRDLPKSTMGVDLEHDFTPKYIPVAGKKELISELKKAASQADTVYLATDPDRDGEAIAGHLAVSLGIPEEKAMRVTFNTVTKSVVKEAIKNPRGIDMDLVNAQETRRILDRIIGYKVSPFLWKAVKSGLSAGRVQSAVTKLIVDRENEIRAFVPKEYWNFSANMECMLFSVCRWRFRRKSLTNSPIPSKKSSHLQLLHIRHFSAGFQWMNRHGRASLCHCF